MSSLWLRVYVAHFAFLAGPPPAAREYMRPFLRLSGPSLDAGCEYEASQRGGATESQPVGHAVSRPLTVAHARSGPGQASAAQRVRTLPAATLVMYVGLHAQVA